MSRARAAMYGGVACVAALAYCESRHANASPRSAAPQVILEHGRIYTLDAAGPWAQAVALGGGKIIAVGTDADIAALRAKSTRVIDLGGRLVTPGLIDSHVHFIDGGWYLRNVPLRDASTMAEVSRRVAQYAVNHPQGDWIQGEGWSYGYPDLPHGEFHRELLDRISGSHPVFLDIDMAHAAWVNSEALKRAGITRATPDPAGGEIVRGPDGEPTGWLKRGRGHQAGAGHHAGAAAARHSSRPARGHARGESALHHPRRQRGRRLCEEMEVEFAVLQVVPGLRGCVPSSRCDGQRVQSYEPRVAQQRPAL